VEKALAYRDRMGFTSGEANEGELAAFISFAQAFPSRFLALVDTYDTAKVGVHPVVAAAVVVGFPLPSPSFFSSSSSSQLLFSSSCFFPFFILLLLPLL
jgi:hypothetical protein